MVKVWLFCHLRCVIITANWEYTVFLSSSVKELRIFHIDGATYLCSDTRANWRHLGIYKQFIRIQAYIRDANIRRYFPRMAHGRYQT